MIPVQLDKCIAVFIVMSKHLHLRWAFCCQTKLSDSVNVKYYEEPEEKEADVEKVKRLNQKYFKNRHRILNILFPIPTMSSMR